MILSLVSGMLRPLSVLSLLTAAALSQAPLTIGNIFVVRVGDGLAPLTNGAVATFVEEYTSTGTFVQSIPMPTAVVGANQPLTNAGTSTSEGFLNLSANGQYLTLAGYSALPGTLAIVATPSLTTPRVIGRISLTAAIDTSTTITDGYSAGNIRSVVSGDGTNFWTSGNASANAGVRFATLGGSTTVGINAGAPSNTRVAGIYNGQLYTTSSSTGYYSVCSVGVGVPTVGPATISVLTGLPVTVGPSAYDFWFADPQTLYIADDRVVASNGGIHKYALVAGTWTLQYIMQAPGTAGCRGLSGWKQNGVTTLWATTGSQLVSVIDVGVGSVVTSLAAAPTNTAFRGVRYLGKATTLQRLPATCGAADIIATGNGEIGTDLITTVLNPLGFAFVGYGLTSFGPGLPFCNCTVLHDFSFLAGGPQSTLSLPFTPSLIGLQLRIQGLDFLAPGGCPDPLFTLTDGYEVTIQ